MPAACAADLREELLARVWGPTIRAASRQDAELAAAMDALETAGELTPPDDWEFGELVPDPRCGPPDGADAWLADLPAELLFEYIAATEGPPCREAIVAERLPRQPGDGPQAGDGCGFATGGVADELPSGPVLAGLAGDAWAAGLGRLSDDELIGVLRAARRLASWSAALELAAVTDLAAGGIDRYRATVIADELPGLGGEHAAAVEQEVLDHAPGQTTGQLRAAASRAVLGSGTCGHGPPGAVNLTMPLATWPGLSDAPGQAAGYGPLDASDSRDLAARLAMQRGSRWCITLTGEGVRPVAHGRARTGPGPSGRSRPPPQRSPRSGGPPRRAATSPGWPAEARDGVNAPRVWRVP
jgi:hypothetical protein